MIPRRVVKRVDTREWLCLDDVGIGFCSLCVGEAVDREGGRDGQSGGCVFAASDLASRLSDLLAQYWCNGASSS